MQKRYQEPLISTMQVRHYEGKRRNVSWNSVIIGVQTLIIFVLHFNSTVICAPSTETKKTSIPTDNEAAQKGLVRKENKNNQLVGGDGGAWTAKTHLSSYGFNVDWGLLEVLEDACRQIENSHNEPDSQWRQYVGNDNAHPLNGFWVAPKVVDAKVIEIGCGVGVYVDALVKEQNKRKRKVFGIEPNPMGGTFNRKHGGPKQLAVNFLEHGNTLEYAKVIRDKNINGQFFDLIYSIEVFEHMPLDRHLDAAYFLAGLAQVGSKLIFGAGSPGQTGTGHIGNRPKKQWEEILMNVGFVKDEAQTIKATRQIQEYNHKVNTQVYIFQGHNA
jgi:hypothetical protein